MLNATRLFARGSGWKEEHGLQSAQPHVASTLKETLDFPVGIPAKAAHVAYARDWLQP
jgi:hypothetical protein